MSGRPRSRQREEDEYANVQPPPEAPGQALTALTTLCDQWEATR